jgi:hypothetical protein
MSEQKIYNHYDVLGNGPIKEEDCVAYSSFNRLGIGVVKKINEKMIRVASVGENHGGGTLKYSKDCVILEGNAVTMYLLKKKST